jgi:hypothetical protein
MAIEGSRDPELDALEQVEGVDKTAIKSQINKIKGVKDEQAKTDPIKTDPIKTDPIKTDPANIVDTKKVVPDPETGFTGILNEMFGDRFRTVEDFKKANIPEALKERDSLRQKVTELTDSLAKKPKHAFASDDIAKFNEFARETGIKDLGVFNKINATELANMSDMDALVMQHIIENPESAGKEPQVRRFLERRYNVDSSKIDPKRVEAGDLTQEELDQNKLEYDTNLIGVTSDARKAKEKLKEFKDKIKMPEASEDTGAKKWTPEIESKQKTDWTKVNEAMGDQFDKIPIMPKGWKEPIADFVLTKEAKKAVLDNALNYVISNQMEVNEENMKSVANAMYSDILFENRNEIYQIIAERARSMSEEEFLKLYHNPSPKNNDIVVGKGEPDSAEVQRRKAYELETSK